MTFLQLQLDWGVRVELNFAATMFLEIWRRKQAVVAWEWDLRDYEDYQHTRPEFEAKVKTTRFVLFTVEIGAVL